MKSNFDYFFRKLVDWWFRPKVIGFFLITGGLMLIAGVCAGRALNFSFPYNGGQFVFSFDTSGGTPALVTYLILAIATGMIIAGASIEWRRYRDEQERLSRKKVLVIEGRGLRDGPGAPLVDAVPADVLGRREGILLDLRQNNDGRIVDPAPLLRKFDGLNAQIDQMTRGSDRSDVTLVYGGLTSVPFTFLTGVLMDDEDKVVVLDWDRKQERWRVLDAEDDGKRFSVPDFTAVAGATEVVLAVSVSYPIVDTDLLAAFPTLPVVRMTLDGAGPHSHWSASKQAELASQFHEAVIALGGCGVDLIHLVLAAPNSVVFRFGQKYDKRLLPGVAVYQFEKGANPPYPWAVLMPVQGIEHPTIVSPKAQAAV